MVGCDAKPGVAQGVDDVQATTFFRKELGIFQFRRLRGAVVYLDDGVTPGVDPDREQARRFKCRLLYR
jgi:hypothetical protein